MLSLRHDPHNKIKMDEICATPQGKNKRFRQDKNKQTHGMT